MIINIYDKPKYRGYYLYVLQLEEGKYYVGLSHNVNKRFEKHKNGQGAKWTKKYAPIRIVSSEKTDFYSYLEAGILENKKTIELMNKYGKENVRGGIYCAVDQKKIEEMLKETIDVKYVSCTKKHKNRKYDRFTGYGDEVLPFREYEIRTFGGNKRENVGGKIQVKFDYQGKAIHAKVSHKSKILWISEKDFKQYGEKLIERIRKAS